MLNNLTNIHHLNIKCYSLTDAFALHTCPAASNTRAPGIAIPTAPKNHPSRTGENRKKAIKKRLRR